jgi:5-methylcytosine-specific restriction endonuclease McrA
VSLRLPEYEYKELCVKVLMRDGYKCRSCGLRSNLHVHHIIFRSQQGPDEMWNLLTLCSACHDGVHKDVKDGQYGLAINFNVDGPYFVRRLGWRPR